MRHGMQSPMLAVSVELRHHDHDGSDGRYGIRCWRGSISVGPDEEYPGVEIGRLKMYTADLRFADALRLNLDDISAELGSIGGELFDDYGECVLIDNVEGSTMAVIEYVQLARVWRGDRIGPAAAVLAANMIANDLSVVVVVPGYMDVSEDCVTGALDTRNIRGVFDEIAHRKITRAFRDFGFTVFSDESGIHYLVVGSDDWYGALTAARERFAAIPETQPRHDWLTVVSRNLEVEPPCEIIPVEGDDFAWDSVDMLIARYAEQAAARAGSDCWRSLSSAADDVTRAMLDLIDVEQGKCVEVRVTFTDVRPVDSRADLPEWFIRGERLSCATESPRLARVLRLVAVFGGEVAVCGAIRAEEPFNEFKVFNQRIVASG